MNLKNKVAIVTGSGQGIGLGIALVLAREGCNVVVSDLNPETSKKASDEIIKLGVKSISIPCNVSNSSEVENLINRTVNEMGQLDILVNNAGIYPAKAFLEMTEADWDLVMSVNLKGVFLCSQNAAKVMKPGSKILTISSIASIIGYPNLVHYCASKGGVNSFTRALALELAPKKINVNAVAPGAIETPGATMTEETKNGILPLIPAGRIGSSLDIGKAVAFLVSDYADYITGQVLPVDGGWTVH
jgi:NAD(P)-dependent dehydrogenase (short-subunit alcohol dehydrogenase family)